jgi:sulfate/thiosulfate-binding protein
MAIAAYNHPMRFLIYLCLVLVSVPVLAETPALLNVSYDPTREFYEEYNPLFQAHWQKKTGERIKIRQSHGGSGKQARSVIDGLQADVVTLALAYDIDVIASRSGLIPKDWQQKLSHHSSPFTSTIVFVVREGNPKNIKDWDDLIRKDVAVITPNPKTSGGARWNHLAAYGYALKKYHGDHRKARRFVRSLYLNAPLLDAGARGSAMTFIQRRIGDVLITWENEAYTAMNTMKEKKLEIIYPSLSIRAEPPVAVVEKVAAKRQTLVAAQEYLNYLYSKPAQKLAIKYHYRPAKLHSPLPDIPMLTIEDFGGWQKAQKEHFDDGGTFDDIYGE